MTRDEAYGSGMLMRSALEQVNHGVIARSRLHSQFAAA